MLTLISLVATTLAAASPVAAVVVSSPTSGSVPALCGPFESRFAEQKIEHVRCGSADSQLKLLSASAVAKCAGTAACVAQAGQSLAVSYVVSLAIDSEIGGDRVVNATLIRVSDAKALTEASTVVSKKGKVDAAVVDQVLAALKLALAPPPPAPVPVATAPVEEPAKVDLQPTLEPQPSVVEPVETVRAQWPRYVLLGGGIAAVVAGIVLGVVAVSEKDRFDRAISKDSTGKAFSSIPLNELSNAAATANTCAPLSIGLGVAGLALGGTAAWVW